MPNLVTKFLLVLHIEDYISSGTGVKEIYFRFQTTKSFFSSPEGNKVFGNKAWILGRQKEPGLASLRIGNGLLLPQHVILFKTLCSYLRGEGLGGNHKQCSLWLDLLEHLGHMSSIDVRHKVDIWPNLKT